MRNLNIDSLSVVFGTIFAMSDNNLRNCASIIFSSFWSTSSGRLESTLFGRKVSND